MRSFSKSGKPRVCSLDGETSGDRLILEGPVGIGPQVLSMTHGAAAVLAHTSQRASLSFQKKTGALGMPHLGRLPKGL